MSKKKTSRPSASGRRRAGASGRRAAGSGLEGGAGEEALPELLPLLPLRADVVFPQMVVPLVVNRPAGIQLIDDVLMGDRVLGLITQRQPDVDDPEFRDLYPTFCVGSILKMLKFPDGSTRI